MSANLEVVGQEGTPTALYRIYDADGALLYVGISIRLPERVAEHSKDKPWWMSAARIDLEHFPDRTSAGIAEAAAIRAERPIHNTSPGGVYKDPKQKARELAEAQQRRREEEAAATTYSVYWVACGNCNLMSPDIPKGTSVDEAECPRCGCVALESTR